MLRKLFVIAIVAVFLSGCQTVKHRVHHRVLADQQLLNAGGSVVLLPLDVEVKEMSASGITDVVPELTQKSKVLIRSHLIANGAKVIDGHQVQALPELTDDELQTLEDHVNLADVVWRNSFFLTHLGGPGWSHKAKHYDYTIGPGLAFIADKTGADKALIVYGRDIHTTAGRKAMALGLAAFGVHVPLGHAETVATLIDLRSGDVLWTDHWIAAGDTGFLEATDVALIMDNLFKAYPGIEEYRKVHGDRS